MAGVSFTEVPRSLCWRNAGAADEFLLETER